MLSFEEMVSPENAAVLVIDVQNDFCHPEGAQAKKGIDISAMSAVVPNIQRLIDEARRAAVPVIFIRNGNTNWTISEAWMNKKGGVGTSHMCREGTFGCQLYKVQPLPEEAVVIKYRFSGFIGTNLDLILRNNHIKTLIMSGVTTNTCVESTARQGFMMDYNIVFLKDCTATHRPEEHEATLHNIDLNFGFVRSSEDLFKIWSAQAPKKKEAVGARKP